MKYTQKYAQKSAQQYANKYAQMRGLHNLFEKSKTKRLYLQYKTWLWEP